MSEQFEKVVKVFKFTPEGFSDEYFEKALKIKLELARKIAGSERDYRIVADIFHNAKKDIETAWTIQRLLDKIRELDEINEIYLKKEDDNRYHTCDMRSALRILFCIECVGEILAEYTITVTTSQSFRLSSALLDIQLLVKYLVV